MRKVKGWWDLQYRVWSDDCGWGVFHVSIEILPNSDIDGFVRALRNRGGIIDFLRWEKNEPKQ